jgi:putative transposase
VTAGYTRILGELKKLGIRSISRNTVKRILKEAGFDPGPKRGEGTWDEFLKQHAASLWQCDFFSKRILTLKGIREAFVIVFLNVKTRQVILSPATLHPTESWVLGQAETFVKQARDQKLPVALLQHDRDTKFTRAFDAQLKRTRVKVKLGAYRAPKANGL